jgi:flagellar hook-basal body complex protein FliE
MANIGAVSAHTVVRPESASIRPVDFKSDQFAGTSISQNSAAGPVDFSGILSQVASPLLEKQSEAAAVTRSVLLGEGAPLHQSMIAMQEASVAFSLMVEVRNKVVEGFQELMRMPV